MSTELYLNKNFFDTQRNKYIPVSEIDSGTNHIEMLTEDGKLLKMFYNQDDPKHFLDRLEWLINIRENSELEDIVAFPFSLLTGLKRSEVGYIAEMNDVCNLNYYIHPGKGDKLFKWYYDKTGGVVYRLKIAFKIATAIQIVHTKGYCLVDVCPKNTHLHEYDINKEGSPVIKFTGADRISSYTYPPVTLGASKYCDPLVYLRRSGVSTASDTYSFAVMLFEMLTTCHPFIGEDADELSADELSAAIDSGKLDYIGDGNTTKNKSENFEDTQIFLPKELATLFERMFVNGKFDVSSRPTINDFKAATIQSVRKIVKCDHKGCEREYLFNKDTICPFCGHKTNKVLTARVKKLICASEKLLLPYDGINGFSSLPVIEEDTNFMFVREGLNKMTRSFFEPTISIEKGGTGILLQYAPEKKKIAIRNRFAKLHITVCGKNLTPYTKADKGQHSDIEFSDDKEIIIELPDNAQIEPESIVKIDSDEYGLICHKWVLTIK